MIGSSITARPRHARRKGSTGAACAAAAVLMLLAPAARAQNLFFLFEPAPHRIERQLESAGYELRGPLVRRGDVYVADVVGQTGAGERLIIDARTARVVDRFPSVAARWREDRFGDWRDRDDEDAWSDSPRPPQGIAPHPHDDAWSDGNDDSAPAPRPKPHDEVARTGPSVKPNVIYGEDGLDGPATSTVDVDKATPKPHVAKKKPAPAALAKVTPSVPPSTDGIAPLPPPNQAAVGAAPNPPMAKSPKPVLPPVQVERPTQAVEAKPPVDAKPVAEAKPLVESRPVNQTKAAVDTPGATETKPAETKPVAETDKPVAEAKAATPAPAAPRSPEKKLKAVNDVPVNPLD